jgi:hypothetical protein
MPARQNDARTLTRLENIDRMPLGKTNILGGR